MRLTHRPVYTVYYYLTKSFLSLSLGMIVLLLITLPTGSYIGFLKKRPNIFILNFVFSDHHSNCVNQINHR